MPGVTDGVEVKASGKQWNSFIHLSGGVFPMHEFEGPVGTMLRLSSHKDIKMLRILRVVWKSTQIERSSLLKRWYLEYQSFSFSFLIR